MKINNKIFTLGALLFCITIEAAPFDSTYIAEPSATSLLKNMMVKAMNLLIMIYSFKMEKLNL